MAEQIPADDGSVAAAPGDASDDVSSDGSGTFGVGDFVKLGGYTVKVNKVANPYKGYDSYFAPDKGNKYVAVDVSVKNTTDEPQSVSSMLCFDLRDSRGQGYNLEFFADTPPPPDGEIGPGKFIKGTLAYEVPKKAKGLTLEFKCDLLSSGTAYIALD